MIQNTDKALKVFLHSYKTALIVTGTKREDAMSKIMKTIFKILTSKDNFEKNMRMVSVVSAGEGNCLAEFTVQNSMINKLGTLHGGYLVTLIDYVSSMALITALYSSGGFSVKLSTKFIHPARLGEVLTVDAKTISFGKSLGHLEVVIKSKDTNKIIAIGNHIKYYGAGA